MFNTVSYDLYTQDWRAKLVPSRLLQTTRLPEITDRLERFVKLSEFYRQAGADGLGAANAH